MKKKKNKNKRYIDTHVIILNIKLLFNLFYFIFYDKINYKLDNFFYNKFIYFF